MAITTEPFPAMPELLEVESSPAMLRLASIDPNELTPKQALDALSELKSLLR